ncbi:MAG: TIGR03936 family radical SAM-associated protein [Thermoguttaceae bacterium]
MVRERIRIHFSKTGNLCFIGHRDLLTTLERLFRRARLPIAMSEGFHPKLRMSSPSALPLGIAGENEVLELEFSESLAPETVLNELNRCSVEGLHFTAARKMAQGEKKAYLIASVYEMRIPCELRSATMTRINEILDSSEFPIEKHNGKVVDLRPAVSNLSLDTDSGLLSVQLQSTRGPDAGIRELMAALNLGTELFRSIFPVRKDCVLE